MRIGQFRSKSSGSIGFLSRRFPWAHQNLLYLGASQLNPKAMSNTPHHPIRSILSIIRRYEWWIVALLTLLALGLGTWGYTLYYQLSTQASMPRGTLMDAVYDATRLFIMESDLRGELPPPLQWARFLAPIPLTYTAAFAIWYVIQDEFRLLRLRFWKNHVIICGLGDKGYQLTQDFIRLRRDVVVIEPNEAHPLISELQTDGVLVLQGSATDPDMLRKARVADAKEVMVVTESDSTNLAVAMSVREEVNKHKREHRVTCYTHLYEERFSFFFRQHPLFMDTSDRFDGRLFNIFDAGARLMLDHFPPEGCAKQAHLLVLGMGYMGQSLIRQAILIGHYPEQEKLHITVVDREAVRKVKTFQLQYPELMQVVSFYPIEQDLQLMDDADIQTLQQKVPFSSVYVCLGNEGLGPDVGHKMRRYFPEEITIVVALPMQSAVAKLLNETVLFGSERNLHVFPAMDQGCTTDVVIAEKLDRTARIIHELYLGETQKTAPLDPLKPVHQPWENLPEDFKNANRHQADHINVKLRALGLRIRPKSDPQPEVDYAAFLNAREALLTRLAQAEHRRWSASKWLSGWRFGEMRNDQERLHNCLVPWDQLSEHMQNLDRNTIRNIPNILHEMGAKLTES